MARKSSRPKGRGAQRIEPRFEEPGGGFRLFARDRVGATGASSPSRSRPKSKDKNKDKDNNRGRGKRRAGSKRFRLLRPLPKLAYWGLVLSLWAGIALAGVVGYFAAQLPSADTWAIPERPPNMRIVAMDGTLIGNRGLTGGKALRLEDMSPYIPQAVIAIEDRRFHSHFGFDPIGFARAMGRNLLQKRMREGGSTITQQLAKNLFLKPERKVGRKIQELILAFWLETKYSKAQILELYLNRVYFGAGATGVDAASRRYFGKAAKDVTIAEAALLAGLLKAPSTYSPARDPRLAQDRARVVLAAMQREGYIESGALDVARLKPGEHARHFRSGPEHFVANLVAKRASELLGKVRSDLVVETTIDPFLMLAGDTVLNEALESDGPKFGVSEAALVSLAPDGAVRALIGGHDYGSSQFNRAVDAQRQPGSAFKTFVWLNALERGLEPQSVLIDEPVRYGKWSPQNYDQKFRGPVTLGSAFAQSLNTIAARLTIQAGPANVADTARRLGITSPLTTNASLALGTSEVSLLELTSAYAPFANGGLAARPWFIRRITDASGRVLYQRDELTPMQVVGPRALGMMNAMLTGVMEQGTARAARLANHPAGGKTGTSQNFRDAFFIGHTAHLVTGVWFGNDDNSPTRKLTGGSLPARSWKAFMESAHQGLSPKPLPGEPVYVAALPQTIPKPLFRPYRGDAPVQTARAETGDNRSLRRRALDDQPKARKTFIDLLLGR